mgnify:CR=1 FL=1
MGLLEHVAEVEPDRGTYALRQDLAGRLGVEAVRLSGLDAGALMAAVRRLREAEETTLALRSRALTDELTGALRRGAGRTALERELARVLRGPEPRLVVAFVDVDSLKKVNDSRGHAAGDELIYRVARALKGRLRSYDLLIRWGGDEFLCGLADVDVAIAERALEAVRDQLARDAGQTFSYGLATVRPGDTVEDLVARADAALYKARRRP